MEERLRQIPELAVLAGVAKELGESFILDGSVADNILEYCSSESETNNTVSLFSLVPALSDIDFLCDLRNAQTLRAKINNYLPLSRFFHLEVRSKAAPLSNSFARDGHVSIEGLPAIEFLPYSDCIQDERTHVGIYLNDEKQVEVRSQRPVLRVSAAVSKRKEHKMRRANALFDLLFLLRKFDSDDVEDRSKLLSLLSGIIKAAGARELAKQILASDQVKRRLEIALLKHFMHTAGQLDPDKPSRLVEFLGSGLIKDLCSFLDSPILKLLLGISLKEKVPALSAIVQPVLHDGIWIRHLVKVQELSSEDELRQQQDKFFEAAGEFEEYGTLQSATKTDGAFLSPVFSLSTVGPPDPNCCRYKDFSRGIIEPVWIQMAPPKEPLRQLLSFVRTLVESGDSSTSSLNDNGPMLAHSWLTIGNVSSVRLDYGFLCVLAGGKQPVDVLAVAVPQAPASTLDEAAT